jgi:hypothetical protein
MKWNCNIVKEMYDRVNRRKFGLLCTDDTSNENFIKSYINRLDCTPIDLSCLKGSNLPCTSSEASNVITCNIVVNVVVTIVNNNFVFTASVTNAVLPVSYNWTYDTSAFQLVSNVSNVLTLEPILLFSGSVGGNVELIVTDIDKCTGSWDDKINYKGGCTDPEAVNYDSTATIDNGTCYYDPLLVESNWVCEEDNTGTVCVTASGANPPYTVVGVPNGTIATSGGTLCTNLPNGSTFSFYVIDSLGVVSLVQRGTIACPFDCELITIQDNYVVTCLTDEFGFNTGEATLTLTPSGGNAPYTVVGSINGSPTGPFQYLGGGVWGPGSTVMNGDNITGTITDANGCTHLFDINIDCPLPEPGGGTGFDCVDFGEINIFTSMFVSSISNTLVGLSLKLQAWYNINFQLTNLGSFGLNYSNIATFEYKLENTSPGLFNHYPFGMSGSPCNPCTGTLTHLTTSSPVVYNTSNSIGLSPSHTAIISSTCSAGAFKDIDAIIKVRLTVVTEDVVCTLCFSGELTADVSCDAGSGSSSGIILTLIDCDDY